MNIPSNLRSDAFLGTAKAYLRYRPPYPKALLDDLLACAAAPSMAVLLDLACGPGRVALDLARSFDRVLAIDLEPEMIEVGQQEAARRGIGNVTWLVGRAEDLTLAPSSIDLITIGEAFHRLDQGMIVQKALSWLKPGCCLATLGTVGILDGPEPWQKTIAEIGERWKRRAFPSGWAQGLPGADVGPGAGERVLRKAGFVDVDSRSFMEPLDWSFEEIVGYLRSTSTCSERALSADFAAFQKELQAALMAEDCQSRFHEELSAGYTIGRKPK
jgi:SAM-dependent methyltransferase